MARYNLKIAAMILGMASMLWPFSTFSQIPVPAPDQQERIILKGGTVHTGTGEVIENGMVVFEEGKILFVGKQVPDSQNQYLQGKYELISTEGKHIYPGLIALNTIIGLTEIDAVRASRDFNETGEYNPHVRSAIAYNPESRLIPTLKHNGILLVEATPTGGVISGKSALMKLDAWNWEDAIYTEEAGIHLHWPVAHVGKEDEAASKINEIYTYFEEARAYKNGNPEVSNLRFEAMKELFTGKQKLFIHADDYHSISSAVQFGASFGMQMVIVGGRDSWKLTKLLRENNVAVVLSRVHRLPGNSEEPYDQPYRTPSILQDSGVLYCISDKNAWEQRNLPFQAGTAVGFGLTKEEALQAITINPAKIMNVDSTIGTLETGKSATIVVSEGDILDMRTNHILLAFIDGRKLELTNHQELMYQRYKNKYDSAR